MIAFLRALNMAGHNLVKMKELEGLFSSLGYEDVKTYIQSGNVIFSDTGKEKKEVIARRLEKAISDRFNLNIEVMVRKVADLKGLAARNPFLDEGDFNPLKMAVIFLNKKPSGDSVKAMANVSYPPDKFHISGQEIFIYCPNGFGRTKLYTNFFEKKMGIRGTARNWKSVMAILEIAGKGL